MRKLTLHECAELDALAKRLGWIADRLDPAQRFQHPDAVRLDAAAKILRALATERRLAA